MAIRYGAAAIGLVSQMPSGPGPIPEHRIHDIAVSLPSHIESFLLTSLTDTAAIIAQHRRCLTTTIQMCDYQEAGCYPELRKHLPGVALVQVIHITGDTAIREARIAAEYVDALLLDSGNRNLPVRELGGTGRVHDWSISNEIRATIRIPVYLAGGLNHGNVARAILEVSPFGVDVCSGVRTMGHLDEEKVSKFFEAVRNARSQQDQLH